MSKSGSEKRPGRAPHNPDVPEKEQDTEEAEDERDREREARPCTTFE